MLYAYPICAVSPILLYLARDISENGGGLNRNSLRLNKLYLGIEVFLSQDKGASISYVRSKGEGGGGKILLISLCTPI